MKAWIWSDLHEDYNKRTPFVFPKPRPVHDLVIIAGDICQGTPEAIRYIKGTQLNKRPVIFVPGNHEFYGRDIWQDLKAAQNEAACENIFVLEQRSVLVTTDAKPVRFTGCMLWTDYGYLGEESVEDAMRYARSCLNDHRYIHNGERNWSPQDALKLHRESVAYLTRMIEHAREEKAAGKIAAHVIVTHHAPSHNSVADRFKGDLLTGAFVSNLDHLVERADLWVHGHVHSQWDYRIGEGRVIANPRGYVRQGEAGGFKDKLVIEIG